MYTIDEKEDLAKAKKFLKNNLYLPLMYELGENTNKIHIKRVYTASNVLYSNVFCTE